MCKQSGEKVLCETINLNKPYTLDELKLYNKALQKIYFEHIIYTYHPRNKELCDMLGMKGDWVQTTLSHYLSNIGVAPRKTGRQHRTIEEFNAWKNFLENSTACVKEAVSENTVNGVNDSCMRSIRSDLVGNQQSIISTINTLFELLGYADRYQVNVEVRI